MKYKLYEVGGAVRDSFLGLVSKDIDYTVVMENPELYKTPEEAFWGFSQTIKEEGYEVFLETENCFTIRAKFPKSSPHSGLVADFVLARKEIGYIKGTRTPNVILGTLEDDLLRRDFTVNSLARDLDGNIIDLFNGQSDLMLKILRTPTDTNISFNDDPLRIIRALRFSITKGFSFSDSMITAITLFDAEKMDVVSGERIREELNKMFKFDTRKTLSTLYWLFNINTRLHDKLFEDGMWLKPTTEL